MRGALSMEYFLDMTSTSNRVRVVFGLLFLAAAVALSSALAGAAAAEPRVGEKAPEFRLQGSDGHTYTLGEILASGKQGVVLAWFPKAFTPG